MGLGPARGLLTGERVALNLLQRINRELGADIPVEAFRHRVVWNDILSRIEMHLEARTALTVHWDGGERHFARGERIHTEDSYKYTPESFADLLAQAGFTADGCWTDDAGWFAVMHAHAATA